MSIDFERAAMLMDVINKVSTISPKNTNILGMAQEELAEIEAEAREERNSTPKEAPVAKESKTPVFPKGSVTSETHERKI
jgi:hypothetical protein